MAQTIATSAELVRILSGVHSTTSIDVPQILDAIKLPDEHHLCSCHLDEILSEVTGPVRGEQRVFARACGGCFQFQTPEKRASQDQAHAGELSHGCIHRFRKTCEVHARRRSLNNRLCSSASMLPNVVGEGIVGLAKKRVSERWVNVPCLFADGYLWYGTLATRFSKRWNTSLACTALPRRAILSP